ncbi:MAG: DUF1007 family protein [Hyphomicrobiaceae bacterium]
MMPSKLRDFAWALLAMVFAAAAFASAADAHPHIWVTTKTTVLYENGAVVGLRHDWTFDQYYSEMAIEGLDKNNDGKYSREELAELAKVNVEALKEFAYFTFPKLAGADLAVAPPKDYYLEHRHEKPKPPITDPNALQADPKAADTQKNGDATAGPVSILTLHFTLPLAKPVLAEAEGFSFSIGDPTFFIAFEPAADDPVTIGPGAPKGCKVMRDDGDKPADANPSKPGDMMASQPSDLSVSFGSAPVWKVTCRQTG